MTAEQRVSIGIEDVAGFEFECPECNSRFVVPIESYTGLQDKCPNCRKTWFQVIGAADYRFIHELLTTLKQFRHPTTQPAHMKLRFQLVNPTPEDARGR